MSLVVIGDMLARNVERETHSVNMLVPRLWINFSGR